ncbi:IS629 transposase orfB [Escherichia coli]|nr:IS629 transposase orfB [Escherichia coli]
MKALQLRGVTRGKSVRTTRSNKAETPQDRVNRQFVLNGPIVFGWPILPTSAPGRGSHMWPSSLMCSPVLSWAGGSHPRWKRRSCWMHWSRRCGPDARAVPSITATKVRNMCHWRTRNGCRTRSCWLQQAARATHMTMRWQKSINGLYKAEVIHRQSWKTRQDVELATLKWVDWYNNHRLMERTGYIPPVEAEKAYYASLNDRDVAA